MKIVPAKQVLIADKVVPGELADVEVNLYISCRTSSLAVMGLFPSSGLCFALHLNFLWSLVPSSLHSSIRYL